MEFFKNAFKSYIFNNIHVAIAVFSLSKITLIGIGNNENTIPLFNLFATILSYNFIKYYQTNELNLKKWFKTQKQNLTLINIVSLGFIIYLVPKIKLEALIVLFPFFLATIFYVVPIGHNKSNLRNIATLKLFLIAISWTGVTVIFPLINYETPFSKDILIEIVQIFLFIVGITIPFDIRDLQYDNPKMRTLPQVIGLKKAKLTGLFALFIFFILEFTIGNTPESDILIKLIITGISMGFLLLSNDNQPKFYSSFWIESIPVFWFILVLILQ